MSRPTCTINGQPGSDADCRRLVDEVFGRTDPDADVVEFPNGESISLGGDSSGVTVLHHRADGSTWAPTGEVSREDVQALLQHFLNGDAGRDPPPRTWQQVGMSDRESAAIRRRLMWVGVVVIVLLLIGRFAAR